MHAVHLSQAALSVPFCSCSLHHVVFVDVTHALWFGELGDGMSKCYMMCCVVFVYLN